MSNVELSESTADSRIESFLDAIKTGVKSNQNADTLLPHFENVIHGIGDYYDEGDHLKTVNYLQRVIDAGLPLFSIFPAQHALDSSSFTSSEKSIIYTILHAYNDAARLYVTLADKPEHKDNIQGLRDSASRLLHNEGELAMKVGFTDFDEVVTLKSVGNEKKIILEDCLRVYYLESDQDRIKDSEKKNKIARGLFNQIGLMEAIVKWAKDVNRSPHRMDNSHIKAFSVTASDRVRYPEGNLDISLKYVANFLNTIASFRLQCAEMIMDQNPIAAVEQIVLARTELKDASDYYMRFLNTSKVKIPEEFNMRSLAIHGNLAHSYILELYANPDFENITLKKITDDNTQIQNYLIKSFFETYNLSAPKTKESVKVEALARLALVVGIMLLSRTDKSPTLNFEMGIYDVEHSLVNGILVFLEDVNLSRKFNKSEINKHNLKELGPAIINKATKTMALLSLKGTPANIENVVALQQAIIKYQRNGWLTSTN